MQRGTTVVGEMGTGMTFIAAATAHMAGFERVLVLCPPHLTRKWKRENRADGARRPCRSRRLDHRPEQLRLSARTGPLFALMSRERAKLSYRWLPATVDGGLLRPPPSVLWSPVAPSCRDRLAS